MHAIQMRTQFKMFAAPPLNAFKRFKDRFRAPQAQQMSNNQLWGEQFVIQASGGFVMIKMHAITDSRISRAIQMHTQFETFARTLLDAFERFRIALENP